MERKRVFRFVFIILFLFIAGVGMVSSADQLWTRNANTSTLYPIYFSDIVNVSSLRVNNKLVCLADGTNCQASGLVGNFTFTQPLYNISTNVLYNSSWSQTQLIAKGQPNGIAGTTIITGAVTTIPTTKITAGSLIFLTPNNFVNAGQVSIGARNSGINFTINSLNILDASNYSWLIIEAT